MRSLLPTRDSGGIHSKPKKSPNWPILDPQIASPNRGYLRLHVHNECKDMGTHIKSYQHSRMPMQICIVTCVYMIHIQVQTCDCHMYRRRWMRMCTTVAYPAWGSIGENVTLRSIRSHFRQGGHHGAMPAGGARRRPFRFGQRIAESNRRRAAHAAEHRANVKKRHLKAAFGRTLQARRDEASFVERPRDRGRPGVRADEDVTSEAAVTAAFMRSERGALLATGLKARSIDRAKIICADALGRYQEECIAKLLDDGCPWLVIKRSFDETPMQIRGEDGAKVQVKLFNQRCFLRFGPHEATRALFPCVELHGTDCLALLEGLERVSECLHFDTLAATLEQVEKKPSFVVHVCIGDSLAANTRMFEVVMKLFPSALHWLQRCESHTCNLITTRSVVVHGLLGPIFCLSKLLRIADVRDRLRKAVREVIEIDVCSNTIVLPPPAAASDRQELIFHTTLAPVLGWFRDTARVDVLPRLKQLKASIRDGVPLWKRMFNGLQRPQVTHYCSKVVGTERCCKESTEVPSSFAFGHIAWQ